ncbi:hypothetical protein LWF15_04150 [Kineosporia rhizophila]|uniref:hypothetical protein n=1 Tax=Kineosporia TaxID=49184 RepID=UPI000A9AB5E6|nr:MULTISPECIES: hypothetical protein [Kineosporia]MCE0534692.1 hypothetical protein [Kineosporia rhizophila]GLY19383.1 hypothetical protein Kisp01_63970 [Kineosporia sp. NBRC 101677]
MSGNDCGAHQAHLRHLDDLFATCHAIGRASVLLDADRNIPDSDRLVLLREVVADLRRDLNLPDTTDTATSTTATESTDGSNL